jgi:uncharacterized protein
LKLALDIAVLSDRADLVECLISRGAPVDETDQFGTTPLITAAACGYPDVVQALVRRGAAVDLSDTDGETALCKAARKGYPEVVHVLEQAGAR